MWTHFLETGETSDTPVVVVHGNESSARFLEETLAALGGRYHAVAPDLCAYCNSEGKPIDATRGLRDFADDVFSLVTTLGLGNGRPVHLVGWSLESGVIVQYALDHPQEVASLTLISLISPFGFGGTTDTSSTLCWPDGAGSGEWHCQSRICQSAAKR